LLSQPNSKHVKLAVLVHQSYIVVSQVFATAVFVSSLMCSLREH